jgi:hypothetical protein
MLATTSHQPMRTRTRRTEDGRPGRYPRPSRHVQRRTAFAEEGWR